MWGVLDISKLCVILLWCQHSHVMNFIQKAHLTSWSYIVCGTVPVACVLISHNERDVHPKICGGGVERGGGEGGLGQGRET